MQAPACALPHRLFSTSAQGWAGAAPRYARPPWQSGSRRLWSRRLIRHPASGYHYGAGAVFLPALAAHAAHALCSAFLLKQKAPVRRRTQCAPPVQSAQRAARMSCEESLCGNTRRPRSTFKGTPSSSSTGHHLRAGRPPARNIKARVALHMLQKLLFVTGICQVTAPLAGKSSFLPGVGMCSSTVTWWPARTAHPARTIRRRRAYDDNVGHGARPFPLSVETARTHNYFVLYPISFPPQAAPDISFAGYEP